VASIARDDPSPLSGMHRDHNDRTERRTDRQTDTDIVALARDVLHLALKISTDDNLSINFSNVPFGLPFNDNTSR